MNIADISKKFTSYLPYIIALITLAIFSPVMWNEFVNLDDPTIVYSNNMIQSGITADALYQAFTSFYASSWVPLTWISLMLDVQLFGSGPTGHHFVNMVLHTGSSVLLYLIFNRATKSPIKSAAVALLFALHPMHVESVAWAAERKDVLSTMFGLASVYVYLFYCMKPCPSSYLLAFILFILGLLSKPMIVTFPVLLLLLDWWPLHRITFDSATPRVFVKRAVTLIVEKIPFFVASAAVSVVTYLAQKFTDGLVTEHPLSERVFRASISYMEYIYKMFWPLKLSVFYPFDEAYPDNIKIVTSLLFFLAISVVALFWGRRLPYLTTGWLWYVVSLLPVIGLVQVGAHSIFDHYSYVSFIGLFVILVWGTSQLLDKRTFCHEILVVISVFIFTAMVILSSIQVRYWKDTTTLLKHAIESTNGNWLALHSLSQEYLAKNQIDDAIQCLNESIKSKPTYVEAIVLLAGLYVMNNQNDQALPLVIKALSVDPQNVKANYLLKTISQQSL